jgi:thioesterase domain-containing protein
MEPESQEIMEMLNIQKVDKSLWHNFLTGNLNIIEVPGNHYTMLNEPNVSILAHEFNNSSRQQALISDESLLMT